jgi:hypothetical protein
VVSAYEQKTLTGDYRSVWFNIAVDAAKLYVIGALIVALLP